ncbi:MAG: sterol desaturase family protein [Polyangiaceae bacterium]
MNALLEAIIAPKTIWGSFLVLFFGGLAFYPITSGTSWFYYFVLRRERFFPKDDVEKEREQRGREWRWTLYNVFGNAVFTAPIHHFMVVGKSRLYFDFSEHGWGYFLFSVVVVLVVTEFGVYWAHRILHHPLLYRRLHFPHHQFRTPTPWTSLAFHPIDSFMQALPHHILAFVLPMHVGLYAFFLIFLQVWSTLIHERVTWVRWAGINFTAHHTLHHKLNNYNFGQFFTFCDRIFGSYRSPYGVVYDGVEQGTMREAPEQPAVQS